MDLKMKHVFLLIVAFLILSGASLADSVKNDDGSQSFIEAGDKAFNKEIYVDAVEYYTQAISANPNDVETYIKLAESYKGLGNGNQFEVTLKHCMSDNPEDKNSFLTLANYYIEFGNYTDAYKVLRLAGNVKDRSEIDKLIDEYQSYYTVVGYGTYTDVTQWRYGSLPVANGELHGVIKSNGKNFIDFIYQSTGIYDATDMVIPVQLEDKWYYVDSNGYKKLVGDHGFDYLGNFGQGFANASYNGKYGWIDRLFKEYKFEYDYTSSFYDGVAAAKKNGKWALVSTKFKEITDYIYEDIVLDLNGFCSNGERVFVKKAGKYILIDNEGNQIGDLTFDDVKAFNSDQYAAVCNNGKWGYVDRECNLVIDYQYEDAHSFYQGVAGYKQNGFWGLIDQNNKKITKPLFEDISTMNSSGLVPVKQEGTWQCVRFYAFMEE